MGFYKMSGIGKPGGARRRPPVDTHTHARACTRAPSPKRGEVGGLQADGAVNTVGSRAGSRFQPQKGVEEEVWGEEGGGHICLQTKSRKPTGNGRFPADEAESSPTTDHRRPEDARGRGPGAETPTPGRSPWEDARLRYPQVPERKGPKTAEPPRGRCDCLRPMVAVTRLQAPLKRTHSSEDGSEDTARAGPGTLRRPRWKTGHLAQ